MLVSLDLVDRPLRVLYTLNLGLVASKRAEWSRALGILRDAEAQCDAPGLALFQWFLNAEVVKNHPDFWQEYKDGKVRFDAAGKGRVTIDLETGVVK